GGTGRAGAVRPILADDADPHVVPSDNVVVHVDSLRRRDEDARSPAPRAAWAEAVRPCRVAGDPGAGARLVHDPGSFVVMDLVVSDGGVEAGGIQPQPRAPVVVDDVAFDDHLHLVGGLEATCVHVGVGLTYPIVVVDPI